MFNRIKNILKSELSDFMDKIGDNDDFEGKERSTRSSQKETIDDIYEREFGSQKKEEPQVSVNNSEEKKHYKTLKLPFGASYEQIKSSYKRLIKIHHPDRHVNDPKKQQEMVKITQQLNMAYNYFKDKYEK